MRDYPNLDILLGNYMAARIGKVFIVGAGPGDPDLLTLKALRMIEQAETIVYDRLVAPEILALASPEARLIYAGKHGGDQETMQEWIFEHLVEFARSGQRVVRLKGGDPCVFGRGAEEYRRLREAGIEAELIPGVSSAIAVPEQAGIPVTFRGVARGFAVVTGHCRAGDAIDWNDYARVDTLVILMGVAERAAIAQALIEAGRDAREPVAFIERGATPEERIVCASLSEVAREEVEVASPAVFVVGQVVALRSEIEASAALAAA